jgi:limonene-1,2-epoxide hydrolase
MSTTNTTNGEPSVIAQPAEAVAREFLHALARDDLDAALALLDDNVVYTNVSLPTVRGRRAVEQLFRPLLGRFGFAVHFHNVSSDGGVVLTERTDMLVLGPVHWQFWVWGRFEVHGGRISVWRDSFDWLDINIGLLRGIVGVLVPAARRRWPGA